VATGYLPSQRLNISINSGEATLLPTFHLLESSVP
jgi:hypothetical protein